MDVVIVVEGGGSATGAPGEGKYAQLPPAVRLEDTVATQESSPRPVVDETRDPERDFMLRYAG